MQIEGEKGDFLMDSKGDIFNMHLGFVKNRRNVVLKEIEKEENSKEQDESQGERISKPEATEADNDEKKPQAEVANPYAINDEEDEQYEQMEGGSEQRDESDGEDWEQQPNDDEE